MLEESPEVVPPGHKMSRYPEKDEEDPGAEISSRDPHVDRVNITNYFVDACLMTQRRGIPTWIGLSSQVPRGSVSEDGVKIMDSLQKIESSIPGPQCRLFSAAAT